MGHPVVLLPEHCPSFQNVRIWEERSGGKFFPSPVVIIHSPVSTSPDMSTCVQTRAHPGLRTHTRTLTRTRTTHTQLHHPQGITPYTGTASSTRTPHTELHHTQELHYRIHKSHPHRRLSVKRIFVCVRARIIFCSRVLPHSYGSCQTKPILLVPNPSSTRGNFPRIVLKRTEIPLLQAFIGQAWVGLPTHEKMEMP